MKKVLIGLGCVAVIVAGLYGYGKYLMSDSGVRNTIKNFCDTRTNPEYCNCYFKSFWIGLGTEKFYPVAQAMRSGSPENMEHISRKKLFEITDEEYFIMKNWRKNNCPLDGEENEE